MMHCGCCICECDVRIVKKVVHAWKESVLQ